MQLTPSSWQTLSTWRYSRTLRTTKPQQEKLAWLTGRPGSTWWVWAKEVPGLNVRQCGEKRFRRPREHHLWMGGFLTRFVLQYSKTNSQYSSLKQASSCFLKAPSDLYLMATSPTRFLSSGNPGVTCGCEHPPAGSFDGWLLGHRQTDLGFCVFLLSWVVPPGQGTRTWVTAGEAAGWQAEEWQLFPPSQSERPTQMLGPPSTFWFHKTQGRRSGNLV